MRRLRLLSFVAILAPGCAQAPPAEQTPDAGSGDAASADAAPLEPEPDAGPDASPPEAELGVCPPEMVRVARRFCVDRFEASLIDVDTGRALSPYYPPPRKTALFVERVWSKQALEVGDQDARRMPLPLLPPWQKARDPVPSAISRRAVVPNGYLSGEVARAACQNAGKRLCTLDEWRLACRGERDARHPYGPDYVQGRCNIFREAHPAAVLHDDPSKGHLDPRLNLVRSRGRPLLRRTGETPECASRWEDDGIYDMVGNLDEWIDDPEGTFVGGFYARGKTDGCDSIVRNHSFDYFDYSLGVRCCSELIPPAASPPSPAVPATSEPMSP